MSPNISDMMQTCAPRLTVAERKEANELRKTLKPLVEKRRRARINESLSQLKTLILPLAGKNNSRYSKLEKADILEMTVRFLRDVPSTSPKSASESYTEGYSTCLQRVSSLLEQTTLVDAETRNRLSEHVRHAAAAKPTCKNCCAHAPRNLPPLGNCRRVTKNVESGGQCETARRVPQDNRVKMWRPW